MKTEKPLTSYELSSLQQKLQEKTGAHLKEYLIDQAFTRSSYARSYGGGSNEILEYIGDTIIGYYVVKKLFEHYGTINTREDWWYYSFRAHEKDFSTLKQKIVSNHTLAGIIDEWDVSRYLIIGKTDLNIEIEKSEKIKADLFEAIIGAYAAQCNWKSEHMESIVDRVLPIDELILLYEKSNFRLPEFRLENAVNTLKELAEHEKCSFPDYDIWGPEKLGYDQDGNPKWSCICTVQSHGLRKSVYAYSKKAAMKCSAYLVLCDMFDQSNEYGPNSRHIIWEFDGENLVPFHPKGSDQI